MAERVSQAIRHLHQRHDLLAKNTGGLLDDQNTISRAAFLREIWLLEAQKVRRVSGRLA